MSTGPLKIVARIRTDFPSKFGLPRQSGLAEGLRGTVVFEPEYRDPNALRGLEGFSHLWLIWQFSGVDREGWSPTVRPPRLGGNTAMGVFATRSPFRPNPIGLSCVRLLGLEDGAEGIVLHVAGADLMDGTPIYDIKPYLPYTDSRPDATAGFAGPLEAHALRVIIPEPLIDRVPEAARPGLYEVLAQDPRPGYRQHDSRAFGFLYAGCDVRFAVEGDCLTVISIEPAGKR